MSVKSSLQFSVSAKAFNITYMGYGLGLESGKPPFTVLQHTEMTM